MIIKKQHCCYHSSNNKQQQTSIYLSGKTSQLIAYELNNLNLQIY